MIISTFSFAFGIFVTEWPKMGRIFDFSSEHLSVKLVYSGNKIRAHNEIVV